LAFRWSIILIFGITNGLVMKRWAVHTQKVQVYDDTIVALRTNRKVSDRYTRRWNDCIACLGLPGLPNKRKAKT